MINTNLGQGCYNLLLHLNRSKEIMFLLKCLGELMVNKYYLKILNLSLHFSIISKVKKIQFLIKMLATVTLPKAKSLKNYCKNRHKFNS
jgi:hypothetical protein